jgi:hypothetical protein
MNETRNASKFWGKGDLFGNVCIEEQEDETKRYDILQRWIVKMGGDCNQLRILFN